MVQPLGSTYGRYSWTQPICLRCWNERNPERQSHSNPQGGYPETCVHCGTLTRSGIYVRVDPKTAYYPTCTK